MWSGRGNDTKGGRRSWLRDDIGNEIEIESDNGLRDDIDIRNKGRGKNSGVVPYGMVRVHERPSWVADGGSEKKAKAKIETLSR